MPDRPHPLAPSVQTLLLSCAAFGAALAPTESRASGAQVITVGAPDGFEKLESEQTLLVDIYFGGVRRGEAMVRSTPKGITINNVEAVLDLLPPLINRAIVGTGLSSSDLTTNASLVCSPSANRTICGRLSPEVAGVILDRDKLRLDVFINPKFLALQDSGADRYLPTPAGGPSLINTVGAVVSGGGGPSAQYYNLYDQFILAEGNRRVRADLNYSNGYGLGADRVTLEWDRPEVRYLAGAMWAPGDELTGRRKLLGIGVETQIDTRLDRDEIIGNPVIVYLDQRARVDIIRDGRVLSSAIHEAGNQQLDTSNLPEGSYDIVLKIEEVGRAKREERRFFTKNRRIPSRGRTDYFAFAGLQMERDDPGTVVPSKHAFLQGGVAHRLNQRWVFEGGLLASDESASAQLGTIWLTPLAQIRAVAVADLHGSLGGLLQVTSSGASRLNFNLDLRHIESRATTEALLNSSPTFDVPDEPLASEPVTFGSSYSQFAGIVSYGLANFRFLGLLSYRDSDDQPARYTVGPSLQWDLLRSGPLTFTVRGDIALTERGTSQFAGVSVRLVGRNASASAQGGMRHSNISDDDVGNGPSAGVSGTWNSAIAGAQVAASVAAEHQPRQDDLVLSSEFQHPYAWLSGEFVRSDRGSSDSQQYSLAMQSTIAVGAGSLRVTGKTTSQSMVAVRAVGARDSDSFDLLVNEQVVGSLIGAHPMTLNLPTYRAYQVRIRPTGRDLMSYDNSPRDIALYPGTVTKLEWKVAPITIKIGRLISSEGSALANVSITGAGVWAETDDAGYFQIEAPDDAKVSVTLHDGNTFSIRIPSGQQNGEIARLGSIICCGEADTKLGVLDPVSTGERRN